MALTKGWEVDSRSVKKKSSELDNELTGKQTKASKIDRDEASTVLRRKFEKRRLVEFVWRPFENEFFHDCAVGIECVIRLVARLRENYETPRGTSDNGGSVKRERRSERDDDGDTRVRNGFDKRQRLRYKRRISPSRDFLALSDYRFLERAALPRVRNPYETIAKLRFITG